MSSPQQRIGFGLVEDDVLNQIIPMLQLDPEKIENGVVSHCLGASSNHRFLIFQSTTSPRHIEILCDDDGEFDSWERILHVQYPSWCTIDDQGENLAYGSRRLNNKTRHLAWFVSLDEGTLIEEQNIVDAQFSYNYLWILKQFPRKNGIIEVRENSIDGKLVDEITIDNKSDKLINTYRPQSIAITSDLRHYQNNQKVTLATIGNKNRLSAQILHALDLDRLSNTTNYFSPNGDQCIRVNETNLYRSYYPLESGISKIDCSEPLKSGCFLDDIHFLAATDKGTFQLFHTRSSTLMAEFYVKEAKGKKILSLNQIGMKKVVACFSSEKRAVIPVEDFFEFK